VCISFDIIIHRLACVVEMDLNDEVTSSLTLREQLYNKERLFAQSNQDKQVIDLVQGYTTS
jgi:hypothetical protein